MSDFLSNFSGDDYKGKMPKKQQESAKSKIPERNHDKTLEKVSLNEEIASKEEPKRRRKKKRSTSQGRQERFDSPQLLDDMDEEVLPPKRIVMAESQSDENDFESDDLHEVEIDPEYQKKQRNKKIAIVSGVILTIIASYTIYYQMTRVKMPDFVDKSVTDVRKWAAENRMELDLKEAYSLKNESSNVMKQDIPAGKKVKKGETLIFTISEGPDPEEVISLPDFKTMSEPEVQEFVEKNKAENISIITEYSDKIEKGKFSRVEFSNKEVTAENYRRRDSLNVYFSKGKEVFEKNIAVPDFSGKMKADVEEWAKKNDIAMTYEELDSDKIEEGKVISQSIEKNKKVAKKDKMSVSISLGKAVVVPNYANFSAETSQGAAEGMEITVQQLFSDGVPYGQLISQSIEPGTKLTAKDNKSVKVVYSYGQPYIKSYFGQLEGDIPKLLYDDFNSKGANITYGTYYVDSESEKGQIVKMSVYNQYIASDSYITFGISNGKYADLPGKTPDSTPESEVEETAKH